VSGDIPPIDKIYKPSSYYNDSLLEQVATTISSDMHIFSFSNGAALPTKLS